MNRVKIDQENPAIQRVEDKCLNCGICLKTCQEKNNLNPETCIYCGACIMTCPVGALTCKYNYRKVMDEISDQKKIVIASVSPAVRVAIGDEFGFAPGSFLEGQLVSSLKKLGFDYVFDVSFGADLTTIEEASELIKRINTNKLPMFTSCCPSWSLFMQKYHKEDLKLLSSCKSPIGMQGAIIKNYFASLKNINKDQIVTVNITPCIAKKVEINSDQDNDYVLTVTELAMMIRENKVDFKSLKEDKFNDLLGISSGAGKIFGTSGGVMESVLRTAYYLLNKEKAPDDFFDLKLLRENKNIKTAVIDLNSKKLKVLSIYGLKEVEEMYNEFEKYDFIEVMTCQNGCVGGSGLSLLPQNKLEEAILKRREALYESDTKLNLRTSYENESIKKIYQDFLGKPLSPKSLKLLHNEEKISNYKF